MEKQRFLIVPAFCDGCKEFGFKFVDRQEEFEDTAVFHTMEKAASCFMFFFTEARKKGYTMEEATEKITQEFFDIIAHQIIILPIPVIRYGGQDTIQYAEECKSFYDEFIFLKEISKAFLSWQKLSYQEFFIYTPENIFSLEKPWIYILIRPKVIGAKEILNPFRKKIESKQQARNVLESALKNEDISQDDYSVALSQIEHLEGFPEQTHKEKMKDLSKQN